MNERLADLARTLDGTRYCTGSSNAVNLQISGPYNYRDPARYFDEFSRGIAVEVGTPSFSTLEAFKASMAPADQWPLGATWAYHDWHQDGNGDARIFTRAMEAEFGVSTTLEDFERKAQMLNYESHRAIFEGLNDGLWCTNSGRILWMTQPAWPSNMWQIYFADYDTHAAYYGAMHAAEPVHIQLSPADDRLSVSNTTLAPLTGLRWRARATTLDNRPLFDRTGTLTLAADDIDDGPLLPVAAALGQGPILVALDLTDAGGRVLSHNVY